MRQLRNGPTRPPQKVTLVNSMILISESTLLATLHLFCVIEYHLHLVLGYVKDCKSKGKKCVTLLNEDELLNDIAYQNTQGNSDPVPVGGFHKSCFQTLVYIDGNRLLFLSLMVAKHQFFLDTNIFSECRYFGSKDEDLLSKFEKWGMS